MLGKRRDRPYRHNASVIDWYAVFAVQKSNADKSRAKVVLSFHDAQMKECHVGLTRAPFADSNRTLCRDWDRKENCWGTITDSEGREPRRERGARSVNTCTRKIVVM